MIAIVGFLFFLAVAAVLFSFWFRSVNPAALAAVLRHPAVRYGAAALLVLAGIVIVLRGGFSGFAGLVGTILAVAPVVMNIRAILRRIRSARGPTPGGRSGVETAWLRMELDHDSGVMDGTILQGDHRGRRLSDLDAEQLRDLLRVCRADDPPSAALIETYLDRTAGPAWRQDADATASHPMTAAAARAVLGVSDDAGPDDIAEAYRREIRRHHPDLGGTEAAAARINEAKRILLGD